jgi:hypothetical protein
VIPSTSFSASTVIDVSGIAWSLNCESEPSSIGDAS